MRSDLPAVSFICAVLLAVFIPVARVRCNVANLAIVAWLVGCNFVHGVNAVIWAGNVNIQASVWCDIVTKLLLGAAVALPGACLSISRRLELASSSRLISNDPRSQTYRILLEFALCYIFPLLYMALQLIVQDHRFDLTEDYGCSASVHPSTPALIVIWLPPLILCFISFTLSGMAIHHSFRHPAAAFSVHLESRSPLTSSIFIRRVALSITTTCVLFVVSLFSLFSVSVLRPWTSWASVHAHLSVIDVVQSPGDIKSIQLSWWGIPAVSIVYILLSFTIGEEARDTFKWIRAQITQVPKWHPRPLRLLPTHFDQSQKRPEMESRSQLSTPQPEPQQHDLKSGWDDMLETGSKKPKFWSAPRRSPNSLRTVSPFPSRTVSPSPSSRTATPNLLSRTPSPSPSITARSPTVYGEDEAFMVSTLDYLGSPIAKTLGISSPSALLTPPPALVSPRRNALSPSTSLTSMRSQHNVPPSPRRVPTDVDSVISSVLDASWPQPPPSPPHVIKASSRHRSNSSMMKSKSPTFGYPLLQTVTPPHKHSTPFQGSSISSLSEIPLPLPTKPRRTDVNSLRRAFSNSSGRISSGSAGGVVYMTVVQEVA